MFLAHVAKKRLPAGGGPEPLRLACIGVGNRGWDSVQEVRGEHLVALCDVDAGYLARAGDAFPDAVRTSDHRELIEHHARIGIDGVVIATPDHTHFPIARDALRAGLPVYCEKPLTHTRAQAIELRLLAARAGVPTQMGTQIHATANYRRVVEAIRAGVVGPVLTPAPASPASRVTPLAASRGHHAEWLQAIRDRAPRAPLCDFEYSGRLTELVLAGTEAYRTGKAIDVTIG